jgi:hypothetical protein
MEHAAEKLKANTAVLTSRQYESIGRAILDNVIASMSYARAVLQMTAASVAPEGDRIARRICEEYHSWSEAANEVAFSDGELEAVARFITSGGAS